MPSRPFAALRNNGADISRESWVGDPVHDDMAHGQFTQERFATRFVIP